MFVKPSGGSRGRGIIKVWRAGGHVWVKHTIHPARSFTCEDEAVRHVERLQENGAYMVQQGISLIRIGGRPVDIRVMVQRTRPCGPWLYSGMVAKVAGPGSVVTNVALSHGRVMEVKQALRTVFGPRRAETCVREMKRLALTAARHFDTYQPYRELGFDIGIDRSGRVWLIEENTGPSHHLMKQLRSNPGLGRLIEHRWSQYQRALRSNRRRV
ncbi:hypothetical protein GCM10010885_24270 [Alicyclobacillus cellulosilyticus]|uniref:YheC/D-like protein n=1 Tax=Alicyclobacillus cellulosilyticus TaxID=1003997 RepID=A0A917KJD1_9BACL|nr:hypothetical protein GCM10010885_24270 [Alicyclobacillus cellulosilyticus]